ncbi:hypothetical protein [Burkholderia ubonensis]|uniref:hypothetical protein n=1 Tax=Burkholderia ubonensis TaxID=101571 RepID=UPI001E4D1F15|nr:hypothetical protein [Burkholderia ubonensis]
MKAIITTLGLSIIAMLAGCALIIPPTHYVTTEQPTYDPAMSARIRILTGNGTGGAAFRPGESCYKNGFGSDDKTVVVGDGFLSTMKYSSRSVVIGMPKSPRPTMTVDGLQFKNMIREYVVPAEKPLAIGMSVNSDFGNYHWSCSAPWVTFNPQPGQDYDIFLDWRKKSCWLEVRRIDGHGLDESVKVTPAPKCSTEGSSATQ